LYSAGNIKVVLEKSCPLGAGALAAYLAVTLPNGAMVVGVAISTYLTVWQTSKLNKSQGGHRSRMDDDAE